MGYEILSDDLLHNNDGSLKGAPGGPKNSKFQNLMDKIRWFKLHIFIILIILLGIFMYFNMDFDFNFGFSNNETGVLTLSGNFDTFNENYSGNLEIDSSKFSIISPAGQFDGESQIIKLTNFTGTIIQINKSIVFNGTTQKLEFGKNTINTQDKSFTLTSSGKTKTKLLLPAASFRQLSGAAKLDKTLNYEFENSSIKITNFQTTFAYDGTFTFSGIAEKFEITSPKHNLKINFDRNLSNLNSSEE
jgi:hypothetical protein